MGRLEGPGWGLCVDCFAESTAFEHVNVCEERVICITYKCIFFSRTI